MVVLLVIAFGAPLISRVWKNANPFGTKEVDREQPALLQAISSMSDYRAASGTFEVVVDLEKDAKWLPSVIKGERTIVLVHGSVDAGVDFSDLAASAISADKEAGTVILKLPKATLREAQIDLSRTKVLDEQRGLLDRIGSTFGDSSGLDKETLQLAQKKLRTAATDSNITKLAEANTRQMLTQLANGLGYPNVTVTFVDPNPAKDGTM